MEMIKMFREKEKWLFNKKTKESLGIKYALKTSFLKMPS